MTNKSLIKHPYRSSRKISNALYNRALDYVSKMGFGDSGYNLILSDEGADMQEAWLAGYEAGRRSKKKKQNGR